ncbi:MAG: peptidyl-prolyl cis-trans isomerase [Betaproteobacteria bacterium]|jgi:peptidyl-prolyl cis-trans isomerase D|nr:peptidyl-prolyl cis-trans isomerase [Betaproteobacteria bacterium]
MFELVHKHKRIVQVVLALMTIPFAIWGIESYTRTGSGRDSVAKVNGFEITRRELDETMAEQLEQVRRAFGSQIDPASLDTPEARRALLEGLISQRLVMSEAAKRHLFMSKAAVIDAISQAPEFQENGQFSTARYSAYLASRNTTDQRYVADLQTQLPLARLVNTVSDAAITPRTVSNRLAALEGQKREVSEVRIFGQQYLAQTSVDEGQIKAYYDANPAEFRSPERVRAEYVMLSADALAKQDPVTEAEVKAAYEQRINQYSVAEIRSVSHILVKTKEEAEKLLAEVRKTPARFGELAKKNSLDTGSAERGGDLGVVAKESLDPKLAETVFAMKQGEMRVGESKFGFHVLRVSVQAGKSRSFEEVRKELTEELSKQKAERRFAEVGEAFSNMVYEQPDSLKPAAEKFKLPVQATGWIAKSARQELGALDNPKLLAALFSSDALQNKRNTDAVQIAPGVLVAARVVEHRPEEQLEYDKVKAAIGEMLRRKAAAALAQKDGEAKLAELRKGKDAGLKWSPPRVVSRREAQGMPPEVVQRAMSADASKPPAYAGVSFPEGYLLLRVSKVIEAEAKDIDPQTAARIATLYGRSQYEAYVGSLRARGDIEITPANLEKK